MNLSFYSVMYLITHFFDIIIVAKWYSTFIGNDIKNRISLIVSYSLFYIGTSFVYLKFDIALLTMAVNLVTLVIISFNYRTSTTKRILCVVFIYIVFFAVETLICAITGYYDYSFLEQGSYNNALGQCLIKVATFAVAIIISYLKSISNNIKVHISSWLATVFVPIATMYIEFSVLIQKDTTKIQACVSITIVLILNFICLHMYNSLVAFYQSKMNEKLFEQEKNYYMNQCDLMRESTEQMRSFRHDMKNQIYIIKKLNDKGMHEKVSHTLEKFLDELDTYSIYSKSGNVIVDSMVNYKLRNADALGIKVTTEIFMPENVDIEINDLVTVLGNLLDNAVAALTAKRLTEKELFLKIAYDRNRIVISIKNNYVNSIRYSNGEIATTKSDSKDHGYGLKNIREVVKKYNGHIEIDHTDNIFCVSIIIFV